MPAPLVLFCLSFILGLGTMPLARRVALLLGLVDEPDGRRKIHRAAIPLAGGLCVFVATYLSGPLLSLIDPLAYEQINWDHREMWGLFLGSLVILIVGLVDDRHGLRGRDKFIGQLLAIGIVISSGVEIRTIALFGMGIDLGILALPFTAFWLLGAINSLNLLDGMDGLLGTVGFMICLALALMAMLSGHMASALLALALAGALLAFLCYNLPPASTFLGDSGSMLVGLMIGVLAIHSSLKAPATVALAAPLALLTLPIFDSLAAITRRKLTGRGICATDRGHIHHCLLRGGRSPRMVLLLISGACLLTCLGGLLSMIVRLDALALAAGLLVISLFVVFRLFGFAELVLVRERVKQLFSRMSAPPAQGEGHQLTVRLQGSADWQRFWFRLTTEASRLNLSSICLDVNLPAIHEGYHARWNGREHVAEAPARWKIELPLLVNEHVAGRLEMTGQADEQPVWSKVAIISKLAGEMEDLVGRLGSRAEEETLPELVAPNPMASLAGRHPEVTAS